VTGSGVVLDLIRSGITTRRELTDHLGWSRVTIGRRLTELLAVGLIIPDGSLASGGGRPRESFAVNKDAGVLLAADIGSSHTQVGVTDLVSNVLTASHADIGLYDGPEEIFRWAGQVFDFLLAKVGRTRDDVLGIGIGVPGPVDHRTGTLGVSQFDPRWDGVPVPRWVGDWGRSDAVVAVDRDVNILALGESRLGWPDANDLVVVKAGMGIGCAFVVDGRLVRGARGGSGQLSAPLRERLSDPLRRLETVASGATVGDQLTQAGHHVHTGVDLVAVVASGDRAARTAVDEAAAQLGYALADVVGLLNPTAVVIGGALAELGEQFVAVVRRSLFAASHAFARQGLIVERNRLGQDAGIRGASLLAQDRLFDADRISELTRTLDPA